MLEGTTRTIQADREEILGILRTNREKHIDEFRNSLKGWFDVAVTQSEKLAQTIRHASETASALMGGVDAIANLKQPNTNLRCAHEFPSCHLRDYDRAIRMLELHKDERIDLTAQDVERFVMDNWPWTENFKALSATYGMSR